MKTSKLVFVYAGDSGTLNTLLHVAHKIVSPKTYPCNLCGLMYNVVTEKADWTRFMKEVGRPTEFLHRDEFLRMYPGMNFELPAILEDEGKALSVAVSATEINACKTTPELIGLIRSKLASRTPNRGLGHSESDHDAR